MLRRLTLALVLLGFPAAAEPWRASYAFTVAGVTVLEARVSVEMGGGGAPYVIETRTRPRGLATVFLRGEQISRSEGVWRGTVPAPRQHGSSGNWRGSPRRSVIDYGAGTPRIAVLEPAQDMERTPIPPEALPGTIDALSAMLLLSRQVRDTGRCDSQARVFDGRRLTQLDVTPLAARPPGEGASCVIESRVLAGIPLDRLEDARPQRSVVHFGPSAGPGAPLLPLRMELASRWWGTVQVVLSEVSRGGAQGAP